MAPDWEDIEALISQHGGTLVRSRKHAVYRFPDGRCFTCPRTPSDHRASRNCYMGLCRFLGLERVTHKNPDRKAKPGVQGREHYVFAAQGVTQLDWRLALQAAASKLCLLRPRA